jgi:hypothetical protein
MTEQGSLGADSPLLGRRATDEGTGDRASVASWLLKVAIGVSLASPLVTVAFLSLVARLEGDSSTNRVAADPFLFLLLVLQLTVYLGTVIRCVATGRWMWAVALGLLLPLVAVAVFFAGAIADCGYFGRCL